MIAAAGKPQFYPASLSGSATVGLEGAQLAALVKAGGVGIIADLALSEEDGDEQPPAVEVRVGFSLIRCVSPGHPKPTDQPGCSV